jgi:hypothetical protein
MAKTEHLWSSLARKEGNDNQRQAKRAQTLGHHVLQKHYEQEARWDFWWADRREKLANKFGKKAKGN